MQDKGQEQTGTDASRLLAMSINPGYVLREEDKMASTTKSSYEPDSEEVMPHLLTPGCYDIPL